MIYGHIQCELDNFLSALKQEEAQTTERWNYMYHISKFSVSSFTADQEEAKWRKFVNPVMITAQLGDMEILYYTIFVNVTNLILFLFS